MGNLVTLDLIIQTKVSVSSKTIISKTIYESNCNYTFCCSQIISVNSVWDGRIVDVNWYRKCGQHQLIYLLVIRAILEWLSRPLWLQKSVYQIFLWNHYRSNMIRLLTILSHCKLIDQNTVSLIPVYTAIRSVLGGSRLSRWLWWIHLSKCCLTTLMSGCMTRHGAQKQDTNTPLCWSMKWRVVEDRR